MAIHHPILPDPLRDPRAVRAPAGPADRDAAFALLDALPVPLLVVDAACRPLLLNASADTLLRRGDGLFLQEGRLRASDVRETTVLRGAVALTANRPAAAPADLDRVIRLERPRAGGALSITVRRLDGPAARLFGCVRVLLTAAECESRMPCAMPPELRGRRRDVLEALLDGASHKEIAQRLGISPHTASDYVKQIHRHYGVRSRGELLARFIRKPEAPPGAAAGALAYQNRTRPTSTCTKSLAG